jgi:hypothetical protein
MSLVYVKFNHLGVIGYYYKYDEDMDKELEIHFWYEVR